MSFSGLKDVDREILKHVEDKELLKFCMIDKKTWNSVCDDDFLRRRLSGKYSGIEKYKKEKESWKRFFLKALYYIGKMKEKHEYDYSSGDFKEQYYILEDYKGNSLLFAATERGILDLVKYSLKNGVDINANSGLALKTAIQKRNLNLVKYLVQHGAVINIDGNMPLMEAVRQGNLDIVKYLVEHGANIHAMHDDAVVLAGVYGHLEILKYLVEKGGNIHTWDEAALRNASKFGVLEVVKYLVEQGANVHINDDEALREAQSRGHIDVANYLRSI